MEILRTALANPAVRRLELAWAAASLGSWAFFVVLAVYAYGEGGATAVGLAVLLRMLPAAAAAPYVAALADRHPRRSVLLWSTLVRAVALAAIAGAVAVDAGFAVVLVLAGVYTVAQSAHKPAHGALVTALSRTPAEVAAANIAANAIESAGFLVGSLLAGGLIAVAGIEAAFAATSVATLAGALFVAGLEPDERPEPLDAEEEGFVREILEGFRAVRGHGELRLVVGLLSVATLAEGMVDVLLVIAAIELLDLGESGVGWLNAAWGVGGVAGGLVALRLLGGGRLASGLLVGCLAAGLPLVALGAAGIAVLALALLVVLGVGYALVEVAGATLLQRLAPDDVLARVFGVQETLYFATTGAGSILAPALIALLGIRGALIAAGLVLPALALALRARLAALEAAKAVPPQEFALIRAVPLFAPLPLGVVENITLRADTRSFPAGAPIITEGERGDTFYVIADGEVDVHADGAFIRREAPGDFFGEIALLRECARTATVRALTPVTCLAVGRDDFLGGVTGHTRSLRTAEGTAEGRLAAGSATAGSS